jgi:GT2 family glycosyltransferase/glycosyltransferase involved in cell wall biosynthesis
VKYPKPYNFSAINNMAAELSKGDYLVLLNNDTEVIREDWLDRMLSLGQRKDVGIVGVRLLHPDSTIQHAGVVVGMSSSADHSHIGAEAESPGYMGQNLTVRGVSAVTAACLLIEKDLYFSVGGLDEEEFSVLFNDVDLCLKVGKKGLRIVYTPYAVLMHHGSFSLKKKVSKPDDAARRHRECLTLVQKWLPVLANDPAYNRNLCLKSRDVLPDDSFVPGWDMHRHDCLRLVAFPADDWRDGRFSAKSLLSLLQEDNSLRCMYITADGDAGKRVIEPVELERRKPDVLLFHTSMPDSYLIALEYYAAFNKSMFKVLVLDDRRCLPSQKRNKRNKRGKLENKKEQRIRKALASCDRLLVPTRQLADAWSGIIDDIRVVPGSIDMQRWADLPLCERTQHLDTWLAALTPPEAISVENGLDAEESAGTDVTQSEADKQNPQAVYRRHGDNPLEELVRKHAMKMQAEQSLFDAAINEGGEYAGDGGSTGFVPDEQRFRYLHEQFLRRVEEFDYVLPSIHLIMVADERNVVNIADTIDSLDQQIYEGWGLSIISTGPAPDQDFDALPMLEWIQSEDVGQSFIDTARQSACDWIALVMPGDTLEPEAFSVFVDYINRNPDWKFIYSDEDCVDASGNQLNHKFKPDINPDYLCSSPYTGNLSLVHRDMLEQISSDTGMPVASFFDLALKVLEQYGASAIGHVPALLYHQLQENECREARNTWVKAVLETYVRRNSIDARVLTGPTAGTCMIDYGCSGSPDVCIAIYAGREIERVEHTVSSLLNKTAYSNWTIRVGVDRALAPQLEKYQSDQLSIDPLDKDAGRCAYFDSLAQTIDTDYMVFMDPGVVVLQANWLERLLAQGQRPEVGVVGIRLLSPQKIVVHAGILTGIGSFAVGGCIGEGDTLEQEGYMQRSQVVQNLSAVSSACMLVKRSLYQSLQGFDAGIAVQLYRDVDFCLRMSKTGKRIVWTPFVTMLISDERLDTYTGDDGISRVEKDARRLTSTWLQSLASDPAYNRNLTLARADFSRETDFRPVWDPDVPDLPRITGCGFGSYGTWAYRVAQPLDALSAAGKARYSHVPFKGKTRDRMPSAVEMERIQPDVLLLQNSLHDNCLDSLRQYRKSNNMLMVLGQDDLMFSIPPKSSCFKAGYKDIKKRLRTCLSLVDRLVVTNEPLADELSGFISDIRIVPNYLDASIWGVLESRRGCGVKPRVGWAGAMQHHGDLEILADAVRETADEVDWIFMGMCPEFLRPYVKEVHEYVAFSAYPAALAKLNLDLAVAPLERNRFNRCKSNLRILEYGAMGWPVIATDIEPYRGAPVHLVGNQTQAWVNAIRDHINELDTTWKAGDTLQQWVRDNHLLQRHLDDWLEALDSADGSHSQSLTRDRASGL